MNMPLIRVVKRNVNTAARPLGSTSYRFGGNLERSMDLESQGTKKRPRIDYEKMKLKIMKQMSIDLTQKEEPVFEAPNPHHKFTPNDTALRTVYT
jgi:hypothetical protein